MKFSRTRAANRGLNVLLLFYSLDILQLKPQAFLRVGVLPLCVVVTITISDVSLVQEEGEEEDVVAEQAEEAEEEEGEEGRGREKKKEEM